LCDIRLAGVFPVCQQHPQKAKTAEGAAVFRRREEWRWGLSVRQLPQHTNEEEFVRGGSVVAKLSVQPVESHGCSIAVGLGLNQAARWRLLGAVYRRRKAGVRPLAGV
jgi:hypothetical protein